MQDIKLSQVNDGKYSSPPLRKNKLFVFNLKRKNILFFLSTYVQNLCA